MPLSDCIYGSNTQTDHSHSLLGVLMDDKGSHGNTPVRTYFDFRHANPSGNLSVKGFGALSRTNLRSVSKVKVVSFLMGLTLIFIIMGTYVLTWDRKGLLFTPSPDQFRPVVIPGSMAATVATAAATADVTSKNFIDVKLLVRIIGSKLEYAPRKVPDEREVIETDSHVSVWMQRLDLFWLNVLANDNLAGDQQHSE